MSGTAQVPRTTGAGLEPDAVPPDTATAGAGTGLAGAGTGLALSVPRKVE